MVLLKNNTKQTLLLICKVVLVIILGVFLFSLGSICIQILLGHIIHEPSSDMGFIDFILIKNGAKFQTSIIVDILLVAIGFICLVILPYISVTTKRLENNKIFKMAGVICLIGVICFVVMFIIQGYHYGFPIEHRQ
jgi:hypothetical protein